MFDEITNQETQIVTEETNYDDIFNDLSDVEIPDIEEASAEQIEESVKKNIASAYNELTNDEVLNLLYLIMTYHDNPKSITNEDISNKLPNKIKMTISKQMLSEGIDPSYFYSIAKQVLETSYDEAMLDANFNILDAEFKKILDMPAVTDMYFEESAKNIRESVPKMCDELIKAGETEKAARMMKIKEAFDDSISLNYMREQYDLNNRVKRSVRRFYDQMQKNNAVFDSTHKSTKLKMPKADDVYEALVHVFKPGDYTSDGITSVDIKKFMTLLYFAYKYMSEHDFISEVRVYYVVKNISMLKFVNNGKTDFTKKYIDNIKDLIIHIKSEEARYLAENPSANKKKRSKK